MARGFRMGGAGGGAKKQPISILSLIAASTWTSSYTGNVSGQSLTFNSDIRASVQLQSTGVNSNTCTWESGAVALGGYEKLTLTNTVSTSGTNPGGLNSTIYVLIDSNVYATLIGSNVDTEVPIVSGSTIAIRIVSRATYNSGGTANWPTIVNDITKLELSQD